MTPTTTDQATPLADEPCDQPQMCATYDRHGACHRCGYPGVCHEY